MNDTQDVAVGHVKGNRSVTVTHAPRYRGDRRPWTSVRGGHYSTPEVVQRPGRPRSSRPRQ